MKEVGYATYGKNPYSDFIDKFLDNPKFRTVLTKRVEHQDLSEIETILLNSIMEHLELLERLELFSNYFYRRPPRYCPDIEDFDTEQEYLQCWQEVQKEQEEHAAKIEAQHQEYKTLITDSLAKIEQQLREPDEAIQEMELAS